MLTKKLDSSPSSESISIDEGWWSAILADEEIYASSQREPAFKPSHPQMSTVDWECIRNLFDRDEVVTLQVQGYNRGGVLVEGEGLHGFVPVSHLVNMPAGLSEEERVRHLSSYVNLTLNLKVIECEPDQERVVFSERAALAGNGRRKHLFGELKTGDIVEGTVTNVTDFGVFIDLGGLEGLIHVSELSWGRVQHPSDVLRVGDMAKALVLQVSEENGRVALSLKRLSANPWETIVSNYAPGDVVSAVITGTTRFGAFARLEEGVEGLIHISSMSAAINRADFHRVLQAGLRVNVRVLHIDPEKRRLGLSLVEIE